MHLPAKAVQSSDSIDVLPALARLVTNCIMHALKCYRDVMIHTRILLDPDQYERLKVLAARRSTSLSQLVREGVDHVLATEHGEATWDRFLNAAGSCRREDGATDISSIHDAYVSDAFAQD